MVPITKEKEEKFIQRIVDLLKKLAKEAGTEFKQECIPIGYFSCIVMANGDVITTSLGAIDQSTVVTSVILSPSEKHKEVGNILVS